MVAKLTRQDQRQRFNRETWAECVTCLGEGLIQPMIHTNPAYTCDQCSGVGFIPPDGIPLNEHEAMRLMRQVIRRQARAIRVLKSQLNPEEQKPSVPDYYGNGRYHGD